MNKTQKTILKPPKDGFRIIWFMYVEAFVSLAVLTIAIRFNIVIALLLLAISIYSAGKFFKLNPKPTKAYQLKNLLAFAEASINHIIAINRWKLSPKTLHKSLFVGKLMSFKFLKPQI